MKKPKFKVGQEVIIKLRAKILELPPCESELYKVEFCGAYKFPVYQSEMRPLTKREKNS